MIVIVDYGMGNLRSLQSKLKMLKFDSIVSNDPIDIEAASHLLLPGVGHFASGMRNLVERGLIGPLNKAVIEKHTPVLGICLGMQLLCKHSEEGNTEGLGWIDAEVKRFQFDKGQARLRVPHVGWNDIQLRNEQSILFQDIPHDKPFYFTHSYYVVTKEDAPSIAVTEHGQLFTAAIEKGNIFGTQFHPEKSRRYGLQLIENFLRRSQC
jgi:glutamine amidotransferase